MLLEVIKGGELGVSEIDAALFGGNTIFDRDNLAGSFSDVVEHLNVTSLRYPGGGVTERRDTDTGEWTFDVTNPDASNMSPSATGEDSSETAQNLAVMPISSFISYATENDLGMSFVIPTSETFGQNYKVVFGDPTWSAPEIDGIPVPALGIQWDRYNEILQYARDLIDGKYGDISGSILEIGNEFYAIQTYVSGNTSETVQPLASTTLSATTYGIVASQLSKDISDYAASVGMRDAIEIHVQAGKTELDGVRDKSTQRNSLVLEEFNSDELAAIDGVISHFYPWDETALDASDLGGNGQHMNDRAQYVDAWSAAAGRELTSNVSEWNVGSPGGVDGLHQVAVLAEFLEFFQTNNVTQASVWPLQQNTQNDLSGNEGTSELTLAGEFFQMASRSLIGKTLYESKGSADALKTYYFSDEDENTTLIIVNTTETLISSDLTISGLATPTDSISVSTLTAHNNGGSTPAHNDPKSEAHLSVETFDGSQGSIPLNFMERGLILVNIAKTQGHDIQSDLSIGTYSNESGADSVTGSEFSDHINLGEGSDYLDGASGSDTLLGGEGDDFILGGEGDDVITDGLGDDTLYGDDGMDILIVTGGDDVLWGGDGVDWFVFNQNEIDADSNITIKDFEQGVDRVVLVGEGNQIPHTLSEGLFELTDGGATVHVEGTNPTADSFLFMESTPAEISFDLSLTQSLTQTLISTQKAQVVFQMAHKFVGCGYYETSPDEMAGTEMFDGFM